MTPCHQQKLQLRRMNAGSTREWWSEYERPSMLGLTFSPCTNFWLWRIIKESLLCMFCTSLSNRISPLTQLEKVLQGKYGIFQTQRVQIMLISELWENLWILERVLLKYLCQVRFHCKNHIFLHLSWQRTETVPEVDKKTSLGTACFQLENNWLLVY